MTIKSVKDFFYPRQERDYDATKRPENALFHIGAGKSYIAINTREIGIIASTIGVVASLSIIKSSRGKNGKALLSGSVTALFYSCMSSINGFSFVRFFSEGCSGTLAYLTVEKVKELTPDLFINKDLNPLLNEKLNQLSKNCIAAVAGKIAIDVLHFRKPQTSELAAIGAGSLTGGMCQMLSQFSIAPPSIQDGLDGYHEWGRWNRVPRWDRSLFIAKIIWNGVASISENAATFYIRFTVAPPKEPSLSDKRESQTRATDRIFLIDVLAKPIITMAATACELAFVNDEANQAFDNLNRSLKAIPIPEARSDNPEQWKLFESQVSSALKTYETKGCEVFMQVNNTTIFTLPPSSIEELTNMQFQQKWGASLDADDWK